MKRRMPPFCFHCVLTGSPDHHHHIPALFRSHLPLPLEGDGDHVVYDVIMAVILMVAMMVVMMMMETDKVSTLAFARLINRTEVLYTFHFET